MPQVKFGRKNEPVSNFRKSENLVAVRTRSGASVAAAPPASQTAAELMDGTRVMSFPEAGVEVFQVPTDVMPLETRKARLRELPDTRFAGGVLVDEQSGEPVVYTENLFVKFIDSADPANCRRVLAESGLIIKEEPTYARNAFFAAAPEGSGMEVFAIADRLLERDDVEFCHPEIVRKRNFRGIGAGQWHLRTTTVNGVTVAQSARVEPAHLTTDGAGTTIAIIDDGVDIEHPEFSVPGKVVAPRDATQQSSNPRPKFGDESHGTACAGVACAAGLNGASGVAPGAKLMPIRLRSGLGSMAEADAFRWAADNGADVISCSWGPADGHPFIPGDPLHHQVVPLPASTRLAIDYAIANGRGGKGCVILFAAGNGNESVDNDGYASYEKVIAVAACNDRGTRSVYSDFGKAVWCAFPSNDFPHAASGHPAPLTPGIFTTDRVGISGYNPGSVSLGDPQGDYTNDFGGTSSACPGAAGVVALILSLNAALTWDEVRDVLKDCCDKIDPAGGAYDANGRSIAYGFGRLNAERAVQLVALAPSPGVHPGVHIGTV
jgi:subtilisin family serine protease